MKGGRESQERRKKKEAQNGGKKVSKVSGVGWLEADRAERGYRRKRKFGMGVGNI